jgi:hypothetical protein
LDNILTIGITKLKMLENIPTLERKLGFKYHILPTLINISDWQEVIQSAYNIVEEINWMS